MLEIGLQIQDRQVAYVEVHQLCPEEYVDLGVDAESSGNLLLAHTETLCTSRVEGSG